MQAIITLILSLFSCEVSSGRQSLSPESTTSGGGTGEGRTVQETEQQCRESRPPLLSGHPSARIESEHKESRPPPSHYYVSFV